MRYEVCDTDSCITWPYQNSRSQRLADQSVHHIGDIINSYDTFKKGKT